MILIYGVNDILQKTKFSQSPFQRMPRDGDHNKKKHKKNSSNLIFLYILNALNTLYSYHRQCYFILSDFICFQSSYKYKNEIVKNIPKYLVD